MILSEKPPPNVSFVEQQVEVVALDKDRVVVETTMRLDVAVAVLVVEGLAGLPARLAAPACLFEYVESWLNNAGFKRGWSGSQVRLTRLELTIYRTEHFRPLAPNPSTPPRAAPRDLGLRDRG